MTEQIWDVGGDSDVWKQAIAQAALYSVIFKPTSLAWYSYIDDAPPEPQI